MVLLANQSFFDPQRLKSKSNVRIKFKCANIDFMIAVGDFSG